MAKECAECGATDQLVSSNGAGHDGLRWVCRDCSSLDDDRE
jgi:hypothetical protein